MKILLDTHTWFWALSEPERLSEKALKTITAAAPGDRGIAAISLWEFAMMVSRSKVRIPMTLDQWFKRAISHAGITVLPIDPEIAAESCALPGEFHKDPADRLITATARVHGLTLVTKDAKILEYEHVAAVW